MKVAFFGTPQFAVICLEELLKSKNEVVCVVTQPDRPSGRNKKVEYSAVKEFALKNNVPVLQPERISRELELLEPYKPDIIVTVAFGQMLKQNLLDKYRVINVHPSMLPKYRGSSPIQWALINGEVKTGVTIMQTDIGMDTGDILLQESTNIEPNETAGELGIRLASVGSRLLVKVLDGDEKRVPQNHAEATEFPMLSKEMAQIDWNWSPQKIHNFVRGLNPWPIAWYEDGIRVHRTEIVNGELRILQIQPPGKRVMSYKEFINGNRGV